MAADEFRDRRRRAGMVSLVLIYGRTQYRPTFIVEPLRDHLPFNGVLQGSVWRRFSSSCKSLTWQRWSKVIADCRISMMMILKSVVRAHLLMMLVFKFLSVWMMLPAGCGPCNRLKWNPYKTEFVWRVTGRHQHQLIPTTASVICSTSGQFLLFVTWALSSILTQWCAGRCRVVLPSFVNHAHFFTSLVFAL